MKRTKTLATLSLTTLLISLFIFGMGSSSNVNALTYQSGVGVNFTFNPTITINVGGDLVINELTPGSSADSNIISVGVTTNASYGYNLSATVGQKNGTDALVNGSDSTKTFTNLSTTAGTASALSNFGEDTWGYSYSVDNGSNWISGSIGSTASGYAGLPLDNNDNTNERGKGGVTLISTTDPADSKSVRFKIGARASQSQPAGTYTNTINFYAVTNPSPLTLSESYTLAGKTKYNGYYKLQDMNSNICDAAEVLDAGSMMQAIDTRDDKTYWITKYQDGNCWMAQNLDLDVDTNTTYTDTDTDLGYNTNTGEYDNASWTPIRSTYSTTSTQTHEWCVGGNMNIPKIGTPHCENDTPESYNPGDLYWSTAQNDNSDWLTYRDSCHYNVIPPTCNQSINPISSYTSTSSSNQQYHLGNYYNFAAALATNSSSIYENENVEQSICPSGWTLPKTTGEISLTNLWGIYGFSESSINGNASIWDSPLYSVAGGVFDGVLYEVGYNGGFQTSNASSSLLSGSSHFFVNSGIGNSMDYRGHGFSIRCLAR